MADTPIGDTPGPKSSVIVPFHRGVPALERVLSAIDASGVSAEVIVVANGHEEDLTALGRFRRVQVLSLPTACGPAVARNRGAAVAVGAVLVFLDADVVPHPTAIPAMLELLAREPGIAGVFGAYDHQPDQQEFFSRIAIWRMRSCTSRPVLRPERSGLALARCARRPSGLSEDSTSALRALRSKTSSLAIA